MTAHLRLTIAATCLAATTATVLMAPPGGEPSQAATPTGERVVWVLGDACLPRADARCDQVGARIAADPQRDAILLVGDGQYVRGTLAEYRQWYDQRLGAGRGLKGITYPVPGNHDYETPGAAGYFDYFGARAGTRGRGWYALTLGRWRIVAANSNCGRVGGCTGSSLQGTFIRDQLRRTQETCELVFAHHPAFTDGPHSADTDGFGLQLFTLAYNFHADLYLAGHDHSYQRFAAKEPDGDNAAWGVRSFVVGTGGADLTAWRITPQRSVYRQNTTVGALRLLLGEQGWSAQFIGVGGQVLDSSSGSCRA